MGNALDLRHVIGVLWRQIWLIAGVISGIMLIALISIFMIVPKYTATALLQVDTSAKNLLQPNAEQTNAASDNSRVESEVRILQSQSILLDVVQSGNLFADSEFGAGKSFFERLLALVNIGEAVASPLQAETSGIVLQNLRNAVTIRREGLTYLISISATSESAQKAAALANAIATTYIRKQVESKVATITNARDALESRLATASDVLIKTEAALDDFLQASVDKTGDARSTSLGLLRTRLADLNREKAEISAEMSRAGNALKAGDLDATAAALKTDAVDAVQARRQTLLSQVSAAGSDNRKLAAPTAKLQVADAELRKAAADAISDLRKRFADTQAASDAIREQIRVLMWESDLPPQALAKIYGQQKSAEIARTQYQNLLTRFQDLDTQANLQIADSRIVSAALAPPHSSYPDRRFILVASIIGALAISLVLAFLRERLIGGFTGGEQIANALKIPLAAIVPQQLAAGEGIAADMRSLADVVARSPRSAFSEAMRRSRASLDHALQKTKPKRVERDSAVIAVCSSLPGEGKSTVALALARTYAIAGRHTLLIDCDLRKPAISRYSGVPAADEFVTFLHGKTPATQRLTVADPLTNLSILACGGSGEGATDELLSGESMASLIASARKRFDYIILDTPPLDAVVDGLYLARYADAVALVIKWASTPQSVARASLASLFENLNRDLPIVAVLNQQERSVFRQFSSVHPAYHTA